MDGQETALRQYHAAHRPRAMMRRQVAHIRSIPAAARVGRPPPPLVERGHHQQQTLSGGETQALVPDVLGRVPIQPPVCGVQPGRMLCLRTTLGLEYVKSVLSQQQSSQGYHQTTPPSVSTTRPNTGLLRQAKLQPLGVVDDATFHPQEFVGVVPVSSMKNRRPRPKSCSVPVSLIEDDHTHQPMPLSSQMRAAKERKRSFSAVLPRNISDETLQQLLSITRHATLSKTQQEKSQDVLTTMGQNVLEVTGEQADIINVEMKGLRKNSPRNFQKAKSLAKNDVKSSVPEQSSVLPAIADTPRATENIGMRLKVTVMKTRRREAGESTTGVDEKEANGTEADKNSKNVLQSKDTIHVFSESTTSNKKSNSPRTSSLPPSHTGQVSNSPPIIPTAVGLVRGVGSRSSRPRRLSGGNSARLSQGWSPPQPIEPLKGNSAFFTHSSPSSSTTKATKKGCVAKTKLGEGPELEALSPTASMTINVNVSEFLTTEQEPDETVT